jgi:hypothetical protein
MAPAATLVADEAAGSANSLSFGRTKDGKKLRIRSYPKFESLEEERLYRKQHLAAAFRVFVFHIPIPPTLPLSGVVELILGLADLQREDLMKGLLGICECSQLKLKVGMGRC